MRKFTVRDMALAAMVAALYAVLSYFGSFFGLTYGPIQCRFAEALCVLPFLFPGTVPGLFIGCILSNIVSGCVIWDILFGSLATLIGAVGAYLLRGVPHKFKWVVTLPNLLSNMIIVPFVLMYAYGVEGGFFALSLSVGIGEAVCGVLGGTMLYYSTKDTKIFK